MILYNDDILIAKMDLWWDIVDNIGIFVDCSSKVLFPMSEPLLPIIKKGTELTIKSDTLFDGLLYYPFFGNCELSDFFTTRAEYRDNRLISILDE